MVFDYKGTKVYYELSRGEGMPLMLLHGWGGSHESMKMLFRDYSDSRAVLSPDFPGNGQSDETPGAWDVTDYTDMTLALMDHAGIIKADIIAHSFGGRVALMLAADHPQRVNRLLLTGCAGLPNRPQNKLSARTRLYKALKALSDNALTRKLFKGAVDSWREALIQRFGSVDYRVLSDNMRQTFNKVIHQDLTYTLEKIEAPTLLVWGENDTATPIWMGEKMEKTIRDCALVRFENAGHFAYAEQYSRFLPIAKAFIT